MEILQTNKDGEIRVNLSGQLTGSKVSVDTFAEIAGLVATRPKKLIIDLGKVIIMDSLFIGLLVGIFLKCKEENVTFQFGQLSDAVADLFKMASLNLIIPAQCFAEETNL